MRNKLDIHEAEEWGFIITMSIVSIIVGMAILGGVVLLVDLINK
jgi:hypothetical protein